MTQYDLRYEDIPGHPSMNWLDKDYFKDIYLNDNTQDKEEIDSSTSVESPPGVEEITDFQNQIENRNKQPYYVTFGNRIGWLCLNCGSSNAPFVVKCDCVTEFK